MGSKKWACRGEKWCAKGPKTKSDVCRDTTLWKSDSEEGKAGLTLPPGSEQLQHKSAAKQAKIRSPNASPCGEEAKVPALAGMFREPFETKKVL